MKIAAVVILYNPSSSVIENIQSYRNAVQRLFVYDNSEIPDKEIHSKLIEIDAYLTADGMNRGIAERLNDACRKAISEGYEQLLTMDQDSCFTEKSIDRYFSCADTHLQKENTAVFGVNHERSNSSSDYCAAKDVSVLITSGSLVNLKLFDKIGGFEEGFFIDHVDHAYCLKAKSLGLGIIQFTNIHLQHSLGNVSSHRSLKNLKQSARSLHSPIRLYYMTRNFLYLKKEFTADFSSELKIVEKDLLNRYKNNLLYGSERLKTANMIVKAYRDFKKGIKGKIQF